MNDLINAENLISNKATPESSLISLVIQGINESTNVLVDPSNDQFLHQIIVIGIEEIAHRSIGYLNEKYNHYLYSPNSMYLRLGLGNMRIAHQLDERLNEEERLDLVSDIALILMTNNTY